MRYINPRFTYLLAQDEIPHTNNIGL